MSRKWLHAVTYLSNVLAPVWDSIPIVTEMLKTDGAPYDPLLQRSINALVGSGLVRIDQATINEVGSGKWQIDAQYSLHESTSAEIIETLERYPDEKKALSFIHEIFLTLSGLDDDVADAILRLDATYDDPRIGSNGLVSLYGQGRKNASTQVTERFGQLMAPTMTIGGLDEVQLYLSHLERLTHGTA